MFFLLKTSNRRLLLLIAAYVLYLFMGAFVFDQLESPHESQIIRELNLYVKQFRDRYDACLTDDDLNEFIRVVSMANDKGVSALKNVTKDQNWSFGQAIFFAGTVLTTIGYGNVSPLTKLGKVFCIIFALVGIPATLLLLYAIIERLMKLTGLMLALFTEKTQILLNKISIFNQRVHYSHLHVAFALLSALFVLIFFFLIPAKIYSSIENWSYLNGFYYCFISLSTVGLGDYVPGDSASHLYKIVSTVYLLLGVLVMVWLLQIFSETPEFNIYQYFTLIKDGILTSHRDTIHAASNMPGVYVTNEMSNAGGENSNSGGGVGMANVDNSSPVTYQRQINDQMSSDSSVTQANESHMNDEDEVNLNMKNTYFSLNSVKVEVPK